MRGQKLIIDGKKKIPATNINGYLIDGPNIEVESRATPLCDVPPMNKGSQPTDGGFLIIESKDYEEFLEREPRAEKYIRRYVGAEEYINGKLRWCLWLVDATPEDLQLPLIAARIEGCRQTRLLSKKAATRRAAATPHLFTEIRQPSTEYIVVPMVSSQRRKYIPIGFLTPDVIACAQVQVIPDANLFHFAMLESIVHMAWMRTVCGRLRMDYRYSGTIVYNNFPWITPTAQQYLQLSSLAEIILEIRDEHDDMTLAQLYNPESMPDDLRDVHDQIDRLVMSMYGFDESWSEADMIGQLLLMYKDLSALVTR